MKNSWEGPFQEEPGAYLQGTGEIGYTKPEGPRRAGVVGDHTLHGGAPPAPTKETDRFEPHVENDRLARSGFGNRALVRGENVLAGREPEEVAHRLDAPLGQIDRPGRTDAGQGLHRSPQVDRLGRQVYSLSSGFQRRRYTSPASLRLSFGPSPSMVAARRKRFPPK